jgi:hypothetical protein
MTQSPTRVIAQDAFLAANRDASNVNCQTHAARVMANVLSSRGSTTQITDPWLFAEA